MKISVIVPVYGVEQYIRECVESVLAQTYQNFEIILVDDGSQDNSPEICDQLAAESDRVIVIHKTNGGLSDARNEGIKVASGEYITFLDGDDFWDDREALSVVMKRLSETNPDVLNYSYAKYYEDTLEKVPYFDREQCMPKKLVSTGKSVDYLTAHGLYIASACNKMIRRSLFTDSMLFVKGIYSEDIEWCARLLRCAKSMDFICENFYCYRQRKDSIAHTINNRKCRDLCNNILGCIDLVKQENGKNNVALCRYTAYQFGTFFKVQAMADSYCEDCVICLKNYAWLLQYHAGNKKLCLLRVACSLFGVKRVCRLIFSIYQIKR